MTHTNCVSALQHFSFLPLTSDTCKITGLSLMSEDMDTLVIPEFDTEGRRVTSIGDRAFMGCASLRRVDIPASVESVGARAFAFCTNLMEVRFGSGNGHYSALSYIGDRAFIGCECLTVFSLGELHSNLVCGKKVFAHCTRLRAVVLPDVMTELSEGMFEGCRSLTYVHLPDQLSFIRTAAFSSCISLPSITLPKKVRLIEDCAFSFCASLENVILPEATCLLSTSAFLDCPANPDFMKAV